MNIFDLRGPEFLLVYTGMLAVATIVGLVVRNQLRGPRTEVDVRSLDLQPIEVALLADNDEHAVLAALAGLAHRQVITLQASNRTVTPTGAPCAGDRLEARVHEVLGSGAHTFEDVVRRSRSIVTSARNRLADLGLLAAESERRKTRVIPAIVVGGVLLAGLVKIQIGISRGRPVGFLTVLCFATGGIMVLFLSKPAYRSIRGDAALKFLRSRNMGLRQTVVAKPSRVAPEDLSLAVALYGPAIIQSGPLVSLREVFRPKPTESSASGPSCSSCGGGSCGGGCGGGGCGGCGS